MARLLLSLFKLRDAALPEGDPRDRFDKAYQAVTAPLLDARARVKKIGALWEDHARRVQAGEAAHVRGHAIHVDENVDHELGQEADGFLNAAVRALKTGMQGVALELGVNIGFLFQKQAAFEAGLGALAAQDPPLAAYLEQARAQTGWMPGLSHQDKEPAAETRRVVVSVANEPVWTQEAPTRAVASRARPSRETPAELATHSVRAAL